MNSKVGMIVGGVLVLGVGLFIVMLVFFPSTSDPTSATTGKGALDRVEMTKPLSFVFGSEPTGGGNAGDDYNKALQLYRANRDTWRSVENRIGYSGIEAVIGPREQDLLRELADHCHRGAQQAKMEFCVPHGYKTPTITTDQADSQAMIKVMGYMHIYAQYLFQKARTAQEAAEAEAVAKDLLVMGWHASRERVYPEMTTSGFGYQEQAALLLAGIYEKFPNLATGDMGVRAREYARSAKMAMADAGRLWQMWTTNPKPGDFFNVIENAQDPAWRVQAILGLGMIRFRNEGHRGDRIHTQKLLDKYSTEGSEMEKRAATAALALTREECQRIGTLRAPEPHEWP